jgi:hypothetical protein
MKDQIVYFLTSFEDVIDYTANSKENILLKVMYRMRVVQSGV